MISLDMHIGENDWNQTATPSLHSSFFFILAQLHLLWDSLTSQLKCSGYQKLGVRVCRACRREALAMCYVSGQRATVGGEMLQSGKRRGTGSERLVTVEETEEGIH